MLRIICAICCWTLVWSVEGGRESKAIIFKEEGSHVQPQVQSPNPTQAQLPLTGDAAADPTVNPGDGEQRNFFGLFSDGQSQDSYSYKNGYDPYASYNNNQNVYNNNAYNPYNNAYTANEDYPPASGPSALQYLKDPNRLGFPFGELLKPALTGLVIAGVIVMGLFFIAPILGTAFKLTATGKVDTVDTKTMRKLVDDTYPEVSNFINGLDPLETTFKWLNITHQSCKKRTICEIHQVLKKIPFLKHLTKFLFSKGIYSDAWLFAEGHGNQCWQAYSCPFGFYGIIDLFRKKIFSIG
ncbi:unnamed protein product [Darwinula stevensoni]|uniref:Uncharacterized protein n=1 Tax=Darwinula stevensoni TaxID=69355 RepID=A0A7R8ZWZ8_9CRUS|nr:unnamed protein product [Darwinula stevensoni]CAG0878506.1 unnamed protein product [Darwinula stevensoni]